MKKTLLLCIAICLFLTACAPSTEPAPVEETDAWGLTLSAENVTPEGITLLAKQSGGEATGELMTGAAYTLEKFENEAWTPVETKDPSVSPTWTSIAYMIPENESTRWEIDFSFLYAPLPEGKYRVGKKVMDFRGTVDYDEKTYYAEFQIEKE